MKKNNSEDPYGIKKTPVNFKFNTETGALYYKNEIFNVGLALKISHIVRTDDPNKKYQIKITFRGRMEDTNPRGAVLYVDFGRDKAQMKAFFGHLLKFFGLTDEAEGCVSMSSEILYNEKPVPVSVRMNTETGAVYYRGEIFNLNTALKVSKVVRQEDPISKFQVKLTLRGREENIDVQDSAIYIKFGNEQPQMELFFQYIMKFFGLTDEAEGYVGTSEDII